MATHAPSQGQRLLRSPRGAREHESHGEAEPEEQKAQLVLEADAQDQPEDQPQGAAAAVEEAHHHVDGAEPERDVEDVHREDVAESEVERGDERAQRRQELAVAAGPEAASEELGEKHDRGSRDGSEEADAEGRVAEQQPGAAQDERAERRVVDVAPVEVLAAGDVVQLVPVQPVAADEGELERQLQRRGGEQEHPVEPRVGNTRGRCPAGRRRCSHGACKCTSISRQPWPSGGRTERLRALQCVTVLPHQPDECCSCSLGLLRPCSHRFFTHYVRSTS